MKQELWSGNEMKKGSRLLVLCLSMWLGANLCAKTGQVFFDADGNGRRDHGEPGLAGVVVTDGIHLTKTDADGTFALAQAAKTCYDSH